MVEIAFTLTYQQRAQGIKKYSQRTLATAPLPIPLIFNIGTVAAIF
jgi:hypothetical protein